MYTYFGVCQSCARGLRCHAGFPSAILQGPPLKARALTAVVVTPLLVKGVSRTHVKRERTSSNNKLMDQAGHQACRCVGGRDMPRVSCLVKWSHEQITYIHNVAKFGPFSGRPSVAKHNCKMLVLLVENWNESKWLKHSLRRHWAHFVGGLRFCQYTQITAGGRDDLAPLLG